MKQKNFRFTELELKLIEIGSNRMTMSESDFIRYLIYENFTKDEIKNIANSLGLSTHSEEL